MARDTDQTELIEKLTEVKDTASARDKKFVGDLCSKGAKWDLSQPQMKWVRIFVDRYAGDADTSTSGVRGEGKTHTPNPSDFRFRPTASVVSLDDDVKELNDLRKYLPARDQNFVQSLCRFHAKKGFLTGGQMPHFMRLLNEARDLKSTHADRMAARDAARVAREAEAERQRILHTPVDDADAIPDFDAVIEMFDAAGETLTQTKVHLLADDGTEVVVRSNRRKGEGNDVLYVQDAQQVWGKTRSVQHEARKFQMGHITKATNAWNLTPATSTSVIDMMNEFKANPIKVISEMGRKLGRCCYCRKELSTYESTAHGYGKICAGHYSLPYSKATADIINDKISAKTLEVLIVMDDAGEYAVKDRASGQVICTFKSRQAANAYADQFSIVEAI